MIFNVRAGFDSHALLRPSSPEGVAREEFLEKYGLRGDYLLFVGAGDARKNVHGCYRHIVCCPRRCEHDISLLLWERVILPACWSLQVRCNSGLAI